MTFNGMHIASHRTFMFTITFFDKILRRSVLMYGSHLDEFPSPLASL
jgi:hypothetical protein